MHRFLIAALMFCVTLAPGANAQTSTDAHAARALEIIEIMTEASSLMPTPPVPREPELYVAALDAMVATMREDRPRLQDLRARIDALPLLDPGDDPDLHRTTTGLETFAGEMIDTMLLMGKDLEEFALAFHARDQVRFDAANVRLRTSVVVSLESMVGTMRALKVATAWGDPPEMAKIENVALVVEVLIELTRYKLDIISAREAGDAILAHTAAIAKELPIARSLLEMDARTFGGAPLTPEDIFDQIARTDWRMLEIVETFSTDSEALAKRMAAGKASRAEIDTGYLALRAQMNEVRTLYAEVTALGVEALENELQGD